jgi:hypothetical protein
LQVDISAVNLSPKNGVLDNGDYHECSMVAFAGTSRSQVRLQQFYLSLVRAILSHESLSTMRQSLHVDDERRHNETEQKLRISL